MDGLDALGVRYSKIDLSLFGERSPWTVTADGVSNAGNRRVELFIEAPVPKVRPLPTIVAPAPALPTRSSPSSPTESGITRDAEPNAEGDADRTIRSSSRDRRLM